MKSLFIIITLFTIQLNSFSQTINKDLSISTKNKTYIINKSYINDIHQIDKGDTLINNELAGTFIISGEKSLFRFWEKKKDGIINGIDIFHPSLKLWNGIIKTDNYQKVKQLLPNGKVSIDPDLGDLICYIIKTNSPLSLLIYFNVGPVNFMDSDVPQTVLLDLLNKQSEIEFISIYDPK